MSSPPKQVSAPKQIPKSERVERYHFRDFKWPEVDPSAATPQTFHDCLFDAVDFSGIDLRGSVFARCRFQSAVLRGTTLNDASFEQCWFCSQDAESPADLSFASLRQATFTRCDLTTVALQNADLYGARFASCGAQGADFANASTSFGKGELGTLVDIAFEGCNLAYADLSRTNLTGASLTECRLSHAVLNDCSLREADLSGSDLTNIEARGLELQGADLRGATFNNLDVREIDLTGARITPDQALALLDAIGIEVMIGDGP